LRDDSASATLRSSLPAAESGALSTSGHPIARCHQRRVQRHLTKQRHVGTYRNGQPLGDLPAAALAEQLHGGAVGQQQPDMFSTTPTSFWCV